MRKISWKQLTLSEQDFTTAVSVLARARGGLGIRPEFHRSYRKSRNVVVLRNGNTYVGTVNLASHREIYNGFHN